MLCSWVQIKLVLEWTGGLVCVFTKRSTASCQSLASQNGYMTNRQRTTHSLLHDVVTIELPQLLSAAITVSHHWHLGSSIAAAVPGTMSYIYSPLKKLSPQPQSGWWVLVFIGYFFWVLLFKTLTATVLIGTYIHRMGTYTSSLQLASSRRARKTEKRLVHTPGTHVKRLISPRCGDSGLFSDSSALCDVRVRTRYSILVRIL